MYLLKRKDEVFQRFVEWKAMVENGGGGKLKVLRSESDGEYTAKRFQEYLKAEGVRHEVTVPKTSRQNGVAERLNRTLMEMVRTMLIESNLDQRFWGEAMSTAVYLRNRSPMAVIGMTPHEALYGEKPNMRHLRAFGCASYPLIMKDERKKLDPVTKRCVLVGYGTEVKGYRLYDSSRGKVLYSRDVKFNEMEFGLEKEAGLGSLSTMWSWMCHHLPLKYRRMKYRRMKYRRMKYRRANYVSTTQRLCIKLSAHISMNEIQRFLCTSSAVCTKGTPMVLALGTWFTKLNPFRTVMIKSIHQTVNCQLDAHAISLFSELVI